MTIQVYRAVNTAGVKGRAGGVVAQKDDRLAAGSLRLERLVHGVAGGVADHGQIRLRHTEGAVGVLSNAGILHHVLGGIAGERTVGDSDGSLSGIGDSNQAIVVGIGAQLTIDGATADADLGQLALGFVVTHGRHVTFDGAAFDAQSAVVPVAVRPGRHCAVDRAALDGSSVPVLNGVAVGGVQRAAVQEQIAAIDLDHDEVVLRKRAALDIQAGILCNAVIADTHQRCSLAGRITAVVRDDAALEGEPAAALNVDDIVGADAGVLRGVLTHDRAGLLRAAVLDRHACGDRQCGLAFAGAAVEGMTVQVKRHVGRADGDIFLGIRQHRHGRISTGRIDGSLQRLVSRLADLRDICRGLTAVLFAAGLAALGAVLAAACTAGLFVTGCTCGCTRAFSCTGFSCRPCACAQAQRHDQRQYQTQYLFHITYPGVQISADTLVLISIKTQMQRYLCG